MHENIKYAMELNKYIQEVIADAANFETYEVFFTEHKRRFNISKGIQMANAKKEHGSKNNQGVNDMGLLKRNKADDHQS